MHESFSERDACFYCGDPLLKIERKSKAIGCSACFDRFANGGKHPRLIVAHTDAAIDTSKPAYIAVPLAVMPFIQKTSSEPAECGLHFFARRLVNEETVRIYVTEKEDWQCTD